jgi:hypothetical protein
MHPTRELGGRKGELELVSDEGERSKGGLWRAALCDLNKHRPREISFGLSGHDH